MKILSRRFLLLRSHSAKSLVNILLRTNVFLERKKDAVDHANVQSLKYTSTFWQMKQLDLSVLKEKIVLSPITWNVVLAMKYLFCAKHATNNKQVIQKVPDQDVIITNQPIVVSLKGIASIIISHSLYGWQTSWYEWLKISV